MEDLNPNSLKTVETAYVEPSVAMDALDIMSKLRKQEKNPEEEQEKLYPSALAYQFERVGYFALDKESDTKKLILNRVVTLRDTWAVPKSKKAKNTGDAPVRRRGAGGGGGGSNQPLDDIRRIALRAGTILTADAHPEADSLLVLTVDCGDTLEQEDGSVEKDEPRTVVAGLAGKIPTDELVGKKVVCLTNLKPAKMRGIESRAMLLAAENAEDGSLQLLNLGENVSNGDLISFENIEDPQPDVMLKSKGAVKVWDRVKAQLKTDADGYAAYYNNEGSDKCRFKTADGGNIQTTFSDAIIG